MNYYQIESSTRFPIQTSNISLSQQFIYLVTNINLILTQYCHVKISEHCNGLYAIISQFQLSNYTQVKRIVFPIIPFLSSN